MPYLEFVFVKSNLKYCPCDFKNLHAVLTLSFEKHGIGYRVPITYIIRTYYVNFARDDGELHCTYIGTYRFVFVQIQAYMA